MTDPARDSAIADYYTVFAHFADRAQEYQAVSSDLAKTVSAAAMLFLTAADAELNDPEPRQAPIKVCCAWCITYRALPEDAKPPHPSEVVHA